MTPKRTIEAPTKLWLRPSDVAAEYGITKGTLYRLFAAGLPSAKIGGRAGHRGTRLIKRADIDSFLAARREVAAS